MCAVCMLAGLKSYRAFCSGGESGRISVAFYLISGVRFTGTTEEKQISGPENQGEGVVLISEEKC